MKKLIPVFYFLFFFNVVFGIANGDKRSVTIAPIPDEPIKLENPVTVQYLKDQSAKSKTEACPPLLINIFSLKLIAFLPILEATGNPSFSIRYVQWAQWPERGFLTT
jgi:hypothetical protein